ncbi:DnaD domain protein [Metabacillus idriensis]|uniref:DnaD domain-containing protein n=1 Tax=Metabacillus idriensis TaxID=324768 RepID=UPI00203DD061|nr:DnaD domain protein [Metabacillus idriensis]MCM3596109.1 DnaD domain protein [Metabacillus idriensis]
MSSTLLVSDQVMMIQPSLACQIGLKESILLQQFHFWLLRSEEKIDGAAWITKTYEELQKEFPFLSLITIKRTLQKLENLRLLKVSGNGCGAKAKQYTIQYEELNKLIMEQNEQLIETKRGHENKTSSSSDQNEQVPETKRAQEDKMSTCSEQNEQLVEAKRAQEDKMSISSEQNEQLIETKRAQEKDKMSTSFIKENLKTLKEKENKIIEFFEQSGFGECKPEIAQSLLKWQSDFDDSMIIEALKTAKAYNATSWRYAVKVLSDWKLKNIKTHDDVSQQQRAGTTRNHPKIIRKEPVPDWLKEQLQQPEIEQPEDDKKESVQTLRDRIERYINREEEDVPYKLFL